nr:unnamed protein product [Digitaria exilis]
MTQILLPLSPPWVLLKSRITGRYIRKATWI